MDALVKSVFTAPLATLFIVAGMLFLLIAVVGNISGKIEPGEKARMVSGVVGFIFIALGLSMYLLQKTPGVPESPVGSPLQTESGQAGNAFQGPPTDAPLLKQEPVPGSQPIRKKDAVDSPMETTSHGVVASITQFKKSGELVMLELMLRNTSSQGRLACFAPQTTNLIDEATGDSWQPKDYTGQPCTTLEGNKSSRVWMKFEISEAEKRTFSLSSPFLRGILDKLVVAEPS